MSEIRALQTLLPLLLLVSLFAGCGDGRPRRVPVAGQVFIDDKPLTTGFVRIVPDNMRAATGTLDSEGRFRLSTFDPDDGCVPGTHRVEIVAKKTITQSEFLWLVPPKYQSVETSGLTVTIDGPTDNLRIDLTWEGGKPFVERYESSGDFDPARL